ncbi:hypothetical protein ACFV4Q_02500 [Streptomyces nojiriensis]|uniref:hypothetical protein n=1 Tax=Streptomyces nojiriensis TaxID=66374 RepID=UPI003654547D
MRQFSFDTAEGRGGGETRETGCCSNTLRHALIAECAHGRMAVRGDRRRWARDGVWNWVVASEEWMAHPRLKRIISERELGDVALEEVAARSAPDVWRAPSDGEPGPPRPALRFVALAGARACTPRVPNRTYANQDGQKMTFGIEFQMRLAFPSSEDFEAWRGHILIEQRARLEPLPRFSEKFDEFDEDLLTDLIVEDASTLEEALGELRRVGHEITAEDVAEWMPAVDDEGNPGIYLLETRKLRRDSRVEALLDHLRVNPAPSLLRVHRMSLHHHADVMASGAFRDHDTYCEYRLPLIFAGTSAKEFGGAGRVSFFGVEDMEPVALFVDIHQNAVAIDEPDVQDAAAWIVRERFEATTASRLRPTGMGDAERAGTVFRRGDQGLDIS